MHRRSRARSAFSGSTSADEQKAFQINNLKRHDLDQGGAEALHVGVSCVPGREWIPVCDVQLGIVCLYSEGFSAVSGVRGVWRALCSRHTGRGKATQAVL
ncbi:hypothetical protein EVAR_2213_1 [Eumeta japonica]|uniref:Uncharacterized protein n=1 Tax=Eumeta variegata TaxID=151549 RepID=A0A4C1SI51_EUMVA|nr:hypothetical protein EVAR_2213_1 [Eumeta japonica]